MTQEFTSPKTCLIVEDQPLVAMDTDAILSDIGYVIAGPFAEFRAAMVYLERDTPDVAIIDLHAQDGSCEPLLAALKSKRIPFVIYSGSDPASVPEFAEQIWLSKPCMPEDIVNGVQRATSRLGEDVSQSC